MGNGCDREEIAGEDNMYQASVDELSSSLPALIKRILNGEEVFITQDQKPIAKLISISATNQEPGKRIKAGSAKGLVKIADDFDEPLQDFQEYMR